MHGIQRLSAVQHEKMARYLVLLQQWNRVYALTTVKDVATQWRLHIEDSLTAWPYLTPGYWADIGSGAGFPGIPLAIVSPETHWVLVEKNSKKVAFLRHVIMDLGLDKQVHVHSERVECDPPECIIGRCRGIISRAFSDLSHFIHTTVHWSDQQTCWYAMKAHLDTVCLDHMQALHTQGWQCTPLPVTVDGCESRHIILCKRG